MRILTIDQSSKTGWCIADEGLKDPRSPGLIYGSFKAPKRDSPGERLMIFRDGLVDVIEKYRPQIAAYETPFMPVGPGGQQQAGQGAKFSPKTLRFLLNLEGVLAETTERYGIVTQDFPAASWRVTALGMGRIPQGIPADERDGWMKRQMIRKAQQLGYPVEDDNEADAIGMMLHMLYGGPASERRQGDLLEQETRRL